MAELKHRVASNLPDDHNLKMKIVRAMGAVETRMELIGTMEKMTESKPKPKRTQWGVWAASLLQEVATRRATSHKLEARRTAAASATSAKAQRTH